MEIKVEKNNIRLDQYLASNLDYTRSKIEKLIKEKNILVNNKETKKSYMLKENDVISIKEIKEEVMNVMPEKMDLDIVYEDDYLLVVNKPSGMVVHPANGHYNDTLVNGLMYHTNLSSGDVRPGIVHRIDKDTSGLLLVAKNDDVHLYLSNELKKQKVNRKYIALVYGIINEDTATIDAPIGRDLFDRKKMAVTDVNSKEAITDLRVLERYNDATLIECTLRTGRTHQIRVHLNYINHPIVNDPLYGKKKVINDFGQCLHAKTIGFNHPITHEYMEFTKDAPKEFYDIVKMFK